MRFSRKMIYAAAAPLTLAGLLATTAATPASAAVRPPLPREAYGSMELGSPLQYETFLALQGFGRYHGMVDYTNWQALASTYGEANSGVYAPKAASIALTFTFGGSPYAHTLNGASLKLTALSNHQLKFTGSGSYNTDPAAYPWTIRGHVNGSKLTATIVYGGIGNPGYKLVMTGKIAANGSVSGTAAGLQVGQPDQALTFAMPVGSFPAVLHYVAPIRSDRFQGRHGATFTFTIPSKVAGLAGTKVVVKVHDGGWGARHDTYAEGVPPASPAPYKIIGGPGVTVR